MAASRSFPQPLRLTPPTRAARLRLRCSADTSAPSPAPQIPSARRAKPSRRLLAQAAVISHADRWVPTLCGPVPSDTAALHRLSNPSSASTTATLNPPSASARAELSSVAQLALAAPAN
ncbi:atherin-like [Iris pallida]|uniref:Atherin-like n=1 Tax=Iris pallida TaxID=29817 RepID=A0AAX6F4Y0_IRIPA|nr:atherin-like [Iris pallida]